MSAASASRSVRRVREWVMEWTLTYTEGLPRRDAEDRRAELLSDLWEQAAAADAHRQAPFRLAASIALRALRGVPSDLRWRAAVRRGAPRPAGSTLLVPAGTPLAALHLFDQTSGALHRSDDGRPGADDLTDLIGKAVASNIVNVGAFGGGSF